MEKRLTMILACLFLSLGMALAQTAVTGTVVSQEDGQPIIGATVRVVGASAGAVQTLTVSSLSAWPAAQQAESNLCRQVDQGT